MNEELNKKNKEITGLIILVSILLIIVAFFLGQSFANKKSNESKTENKQSNNNTTIDKKDNNTKTDEKTQPVEKDIYEKISDIKKDNSLTGTQKVDEILKLFIDYTKVNVDISNDSCKFKINNESTDEKEYYKFVCNGATIYIDKKIEKISIDQVGDYSLLKNEKDNIDVLKNNNLKNTYVEIIAKDLKTEDIYEYFREKYNISGLGICIEYEIKNDYFYVNFVNSKKGWYDYDQYEGKCSNKIEDLTTYKFDTKTNKYEVIKK